MKKIKTIMIMALVLIGLRSGAQQSIAQPYYGEGKIRFYNKDAVVAGSPCYTLDISSDIHTYWGTTSGINDVLIYQKRLFVSIDNGNGEGGVLVYDYADVYPTKTGGPISVLNPQNTTGLPVAGIAIQPSTGNLFVGTFYTGASDAGIYVYTASSNYGNASGTQLASYYNDNSIDKYIANLAFDASGNLWFTEFDSAAYPNQFLVCYPGVDKSQYHEITNIPTQYTAYPAGGGSGTPVYLLSQPEGIAFDNAGNLWLGNNNDDYLCNGAGNGTLVKIPVSWITDTFANIQAGYSTYVPLYDATIELIPGGKLGGMLFDGDTLYINDQGQNQGTDYTSSGTVWKWNVTTAFNTTNFAASGIHTTYPGNGQMALDNSQFSVASDCAPTGISEIDQSADLSLYPNPAGNMIYINSSATVTISIYNAVGELMQTAAYDHETIGVNISAFEPGVYIAQLKFADGNYTTKKFVKE